MESESKNEMPDLAVDLESVDDIEGVTLEERAKLVLLTLGRNIGEIKDAYRKLALAYHPDMPGGDKEKFQILNEAYKLLVKGIVPKLPLLADDRLMIRVLGRNIKPLIDMQKEWEKYERWRRKQFYSDWI